MENAADVEEIIFLIITSSKKLNNIGYEKTHTDTR